MEENEIEIKLKYNNKKEVEKIISRSATKLKNVKTRDRYYSLHYTDMNNAHDLLRVREIIGGKVELTYKGRAEADENNVWKRVELTVEISSRDVIDAILICLGFNKISENECKREYWKFNETEIVFVKFTKPDLLEFMEIEGSSHEKINSTVNVLGNSVQKIGEESFKKFDDIRNISS